MELTKEQRAARITMLLGSNMRITDEEDKALDLPFAEWPQTLKEKAGKWARLVQAEDERAASGTASAQPPANAPSPAK